MNVSTASREAREILIRDPELYQRVDAVFGEAEDPMSALERRADALFSGRAIVWEGDAETFQFRYVGEAARSILGFAVERWTTPSPPSGPKRWSTRTTAATQLPTALSPQDRVGTMTSSTARWLRMGALSGCMTWCGS